MRKRKMYLSVEDVAEVFDISVSFAYRVVERMNADLASKNYYVILGRVPTRYVEDKIYLYNFSVRQPHPDVYNYRPADGETAGKCFNRIKSGNRY